ncbi:UNVERIFIED_CONTAM: hypothetical protein GTU68_041624 [Idotea baltica]|nr:hypothetical protein [Idotea baltica]
MPGAKPCGGGRVGADIGAPFELTAHTGKRLSSADLKGKPSLVYFGYATCPDICPMELSETAEAVDILAKERGMDVTPLFITVDPERDTVEKMAGYVEFFHDDMIGLTGDTEEVSKTLKDFRVYYGKVSDPEAPDGYWMDHSNYIYLLDREGEFLTFFKGAEDTPASIAEGVACHLG